MNTGAIHNKFKFIALASARCQQLQRGARPRLDSKSRKHVTIAQEEVREGLIESRAPEDLGGAETGGAVEAVSETGDVG